GVYFAGNAEVFAYHGLRYLAGILAHEAFHGYEAKNHLGLHSPVANAFMSDKERFLYNEKLASGFAFQFYGKLTDKFSGEDRENMLTFMQDSLKGHLDWQNK